MNENQESTNPSGGLNSAGPIDAATLLDRCMGNAKLAAMLLDRFEKQASEDMATLLQLAAAPAGQTAQLSQTSHALKGAAGALSATGVQAAAAELEQCAKAGSLDALPQILANLRSEVDRCLAALPSTRAAMGAPPQR